MIVKRIVILIFLAFNLTSCFEIIEEVQFHDDNSGIVKLTVNLSQSKSRLDKILNQHEINGLKIPSKEEITHHLEQIKQEVDLDSDINLLTFEKDFEQYIFKIEAEFNNINALNNLLDHLHQKFGKSNTSTPIQIVEGDKYLSQDIDQDHIKNLKKNLNTYNLSELNNAQLTTIFKFSEYVKSTSISKTRVSKSGKSVLLRLSLKDFVDIYSTQDLKITFNE